ncbi:MAG: TIGR02266 family protein, partial [Myxococcota bacterium]
MSSDQQLPPASGGSAVALRIRMRYRSIEEFVARFAPNLEPGGMFLPSRQPLPVGTHTRVELRLVDETLVLLFVGVVRWSQRADPREPGLFAGMGIEFIDLSPNSRRMVDYILAVRSTGTPRPGPTSDERPARRAAGDRGG